MVGFSSERILNPGVVQVNIILPEPPITFEESRRSDHEQSPLFEAETVIGSYTLILTVAVSLMQPRLSVTTTDDLERKIKSILFWLTMQ